MIKKFRKRALVLASLGVLGITPLTHDSLGNLQNQVVSGIIDDGGTTGKRRDIEVVAYRETLDITLLLETDFKPHYLPIKNHTAPVEIGLQIATLGNRDYFSAVNTDLTNSDTATVSYTVKTDINLIVSTVNYAAITKSFSDTINISLRLDTVSPNPNVQLSGEIKNVTHDTVTDSALDVVLPDKVSSNQSVNVHKSKVTLNFDIALKNSTPRIGKTDSNHNSITLSLGFNLKVNQYPITNTFKQSHITKKADLWLALNNNNRVNVQKAPTENNDDGIEKLLLLLAAALSGTDNA